MARAARPAARSPTAGDAREATPRMGVVDTLHGAMSRRLRYESEAAYSRTTFVAIA
ncbi:MULTISPECIES: hypothetical protein [unclassified Xanthomonas]|uniref:hypothetical protein n=1 Tax=unclassified Xanthomonas TaxID=2643310 RepID=UPI00136B5B10|nr:MULTISPECIES: hypothetical protein [unclassified Xanthomonas]MBB6365404.1 hypothetical protein [Xanthomonas sp. F10]UYC11783.1 hypothetical protein NUG21_18855 [Xanthomonas sp. CFBP 8445]